jgi:hypothetical protein
VKRSAFFSLETFTKVAWSSLAVMVVFIIIQLFVIGGDAFVMTLADSMPIPLAIVNAVLVFMMWRQFAPLNRGRKLWGWFVIGWTLWAIGEILYVVMGFITDEVPYPSIADIAYIIGTIILIGGLVRRVQETPNKLKGTLNLGFWLIAIVVTAIIFFFALQPTLQADAGSGFGLIILDAFYPLTDLLMMLLAIRLLFDYSRTSGSRGWVLVIIGFLFVTISDLMYSYLNSIGLYYPNDSVNLVTTVGSAIPYVLAYLLWALGVYRLQIKQEIVAINEELVQPVLVENTHIVFFVDNELNIDEVSANSSALGRNTITHKANFATLFKLKFEERDTIINTLRLKGFFADMQVQVSNARNEMVPAMLSGISVRDPQKNFIGGLLVLRMNAPLNNLDNLLTEYQASIAKQVKIKSGSREAEEVNGFLLAYYTPIFNRIREMVFQYGGAQQGVNFTEFVNQQAVQSGWKLKMTPTALETTGINNPAGLYHDLTELLSTSRSHLERMTDRETVNRDLEEINAKFTDEVRNNLRYIEHAWVTPGNEA